MTYIHTFIHRNSSFLTSLDFNVKEIGQAIVSKMESLSDKDYSLKRNDQAVSKDAKVKQKDVSVLSIEPQNLFNRLISLALVSLQQHGLG